MNEYGYEAIFGILGRFSFRGIFSGSVVTSILSRLTLGHG